MQSQQKQLDSLKQALATCCNKGAVQRTINNSTSNNDQKANTANNVADNATLTGAMLYQNNPNPFSQTTVVKCFIPNDTKTASLLVFDMNGSLKKTLAINDKGTVNTTINGNQLVPGMYYYTLLIDGQEIDTKKMILTE